jgi:hypothetical protein
MFLFKTLPQKSLAPPRGGGDDLVAPHGFAKVARGAVRRPRGSLLLFVQIDLVQDVLSIVLGSGVCAFKIDNYLRSAALLDAPARPTRQAAQRAAIFLSLQYGS